MFQTTNQLVFSIPDIGILNEENGTITPFMPYIDIEPI